MAKPTATRRPRKRDRKNVSTGIVHIKSSFNNTIVSITDTEGNVISWASSGGVGFKGSRKSTPFAAQKAAEKAPRAAMEHGLPRVEAGAQGEHKLARGYEAVPTYSAHYIANPGFRDAVADFLERERAAMEREIEFLGEMAPFKKSG